jgi:hypothetical protein
MNFKFYADIYQLHKKTGKQDAACKAPVNDVNWD